MFNIKVLIVLLQFYSRLPREKLELKQDQKEKIQLLSRPAAVHSGQITKPI